MIDKIQRYKDQFPDDIKNIGASLDMLWDDMQKKGYIVVMSIDVRNPKEATKLNPQGKTHSYIGYTDGITDYDIGTFRENVFNRS